MWKSAKIIKGFRQSFVGLLMFVLSCSGFLKPAKGVARAWGGYSSPCQPVILNDKGAWNKWKNHRRAMPHKTGEKPPSVLLVINYRAGVWKLCSPTWRERDRWATSTWFPFLIISIISACLSVCLHHGISRCRALVNPNCSLPPS